MTGAPYELGPLRVDEADALGALHVAVWRSAYAGLMPADYLDALDPAERAAQWRDVARRADAHGWAGGVRALVARSEGRPVGMLAGGTPHDADPPAPYELWSLNVDPAFHGRGVAQALTAAALPDGPAYLWVLRGNARAIAFYRRLGFDLDGATRADPHGVEERMTRRRGASGPAG